MDFRLYLAIALGYLLGSIPFAHLIASRIRGVDLSKVGSRNVGTRNLTRSAGLGWGALGGALDFGKGALAMCLGCAIAPDSYPLWMLAGTAAVAGHIWPVWLRFRGGNGIATAMGAAAFVALWPELIIVVVLGWLVLHFSKNITLTTAAGFVIMLVALQFFGKPIEVTYFVLSITALVLLNVALRRQEKPAAKRRKKR
jgi:glycerol-3-phosphate acyltransferase PlsY